MSGITVSAATINTIPTIRADVDSVTSGFNAHKADMALHLTTAQNTFLDGLNLPTLTAANVNTLVGQTVLLSTQFANQTSATNKVATDLAAHSGDQTVHVLPAQRTWLDGIDMVKITPAIINSLDTISAGGSAANRVLKTGDTMTGDLAMSGKKVTGLGTPTALTDSANKKYVDDSVAAVDLSSRVAKTGDTMTGDLAMSGKKVTGLGAPTATTDAVTKTYADGKVAKTGDTMSGDLNMGTKKVTNLGAPTAVGDAATKAYVDGIETSVLSKVVLLSGSTMTGDLNMGTKKIVGLAAPTAGTDAATKAYVDAMGNLQLSLTGGTMSGVINMGNNKITGLAVPTVGTDAVTKTYADAIGNGKLNLTGGTMSGAIDMGTNKITTAYVPVAAADLANKAYVDSRTATGGIADKADKLTTARHISVSGAATGQTATAFDGSANANIVVTALDAAKLTGQVPNDSLTGLYDGISIKLNGSNSIFSMPGTGTQSTDGRTVYGMVEYRTASSTTKGCLVFVAPDNRNNVMHMMEITGRTHTGGDHLWKAMIGGYGATAGWTNTRMMNLGSADLKARWGRNPDGKVCLILGDANTVWPYAHLSATVSMISHSSVPDSYVTGWTTALDDGTLTGYTLVTAEIANSAMLTDITGKSATATKLAAAVQINGTNFDGGSAITTANWGTARNLTIGSTAKSVNGSGNVAWSLTEIGAAPIVDPTFTNSITLNGTAFYVGSQGGSWIGGAAGASTPGGGVAATSSIRIATSTTTNAYHSWISQRTQTGVGYGIGTLGSDFFITMASKANIDSGNNNVYNVLRFDGVSRQTSIPGSLKLDYGTGESQIYFSGSNLYMYANAGSAGFYNGSTQKGCSVDNSGGLTVGGAVNAVGDVVAFYSDERLKENIRPIEEALKILRHIDGVRYNANALAGSFGFDTEREQLGLKAGQLKAILPELIERAPFDRGENGDSKSGEDYLTVKYERLVPVLVEGIKELDAENFGLKQKQKSLEERIARLEELLLE